MTGYVTWDRKGFEGSWKAWSRNRTAVGKLCPRCTGRHSALDVQTVIAECPAYDAELSTLVNAWPVLLRPSTWAWLTDATEREKRFFVRGLVPNTLCEEWKKVSNAKIRSQATKTRNAAFREVLTHIYDTIEPLYPVPAEVEEEEDEVDLDRPPRKRQRPSAWRY